MQIYGTWQRYIIYRGVEVADCNLVSRGSFANMIDVTSKKPYAQSGPRSFQCELLSCLTGSCRHRQLLSHTCLTQRLGLECGVFRCSG